MVVICCSCFYAADFTGIFYYWKSWRALESPRELFPSATQSHGGGEEGFSRLFSFSDMQAISSLLPSPSAPAHGFLAGTSVGAQPAS